MDDLSAACVSIIVRKALICLVQALWKQRQKHHHRQADVQAPERRLEQPLAPTRRIGQAAHAEQGQPDTEHPVDSEQGGMSVAAAYSVLLIVLVFGAIGVMSVVAGRAFRTAEGVDMALGAR